MSVDFRTRADGPLPVFEPEAFFRETLPEAIVAQREVIEPGLPRLHLRPLTIEVGTENVWTLLAKSGGVEVRRGDAGSAARVRLSAEDLCDLANDLRTPIAIYSSGELDMPDGEFGDFLDWWLVLRSALDAQPLYVPGAVAFRDREGRPLDLRRSFAPDDSREEMAHFLAEAGFLHVRGLFSEAEMAAISKDMDRAAPEYRPDDGRSWWARVRSGERRLVRMQAFDERSAATAELIASEKFRSFGTLTGDGHIYEQMKDNRIEALVKPIGVVEGISDIPWHKDCALGRHSYECCMITMGISVTGAGADSGQLRVFAGSHRALVRPGVLGDPGRIDLPDMALPTEAGDVTLHCSCTLHMAQPPVSRERRVLYTTWSLPPADVDACWEARAKVRRARERAPGTVSQPAADAGS